MANTGPGSLIGNVNEFRLKEDDYNGRVERFELFAQLNEVNVHKKIIIFNSNW